MTRRAFDSLRRPGDHQAARDLLLADLTSRVLLSRVLLLRVYAADDRAMSGAVFLP